MEANIRQHQENAQKQEKNADDNRNFSSGASVKNKIPHRGIVRNNVPYAPKPLRKAKGRRRYDKGKPLGVSVCVMICRSLRKIKEKSLYLLKLST